MTISNALLTYVVRTKVPGGRWVGVGVGVLVGLGVDEITAPVSAPLVIQAFVVAATVVLDRFLRGAVRPVVGVMATIAMISSLLAGVACFGARVPDGVTVLMICAAVFGWLLSVSIGSSLGNTWFTLGLNGPLALFGILEFASFAVSPAGVPVAAVLPVSSTALMVVLTLGLGAWAGFSPALVEELTGWIVGLGQILVLALLASELGGGCGVEAWDSLVLSGVGAAAALTTSRLVPFV